MKQMRAKLEFDLPEDLYAFKCASISQDLANAVIEVSKIYRAFLRGKTENKDPYEVMQDMDDVVRDLAFKLEEG